jgi:peptidyl-prolyl cis-trans isomerase SurA
MIHGKKALILVIISLFFQANVSAKLLDKILAVVDSHIITLSMVNRVSTNLVARRNVAPQIYDQEKFSNKELVAIRVQRILIREKLREIGYEVTDEQVETQVKDTEKSLNLDRKALLGFLSANNMTFDEYFEIIREAIEFNFFNARIIRPLVSVTDQEVKNAYYRKNQENKTLAFKYTLVDFTIEKKYVSKTQVRKFKRALIKYQSSGSIARAYERMETNVLSNITEDGLTETLAKVFKKTDEGKFTPPILLGDVYHVFFIKKKDLEESSSYSDSKNQIKAELYIKTAKQLIETWYLREENKHYIKYFF